MYEPLQVQDWRLDQNNYFSYKIIILHKGNSNSNSVCWHNQLLTFIITVKWCKQFLRRGDLLFGSLQHFKAKKSL